MANDVRGMEVGKGSSRLDGYVHADGPCETSFFCVAAVEVVSNRAIGDVLVDKE